MRRIPVNQCRRCGQRHEELQQLIDAEGRWAVVAAACDCGHSWTVIHTAPANLRVLRAWMARGCQPPEGPLAPLRSGPWQECRLEGVYPLEGGDPLEGARPTAAPPWPSAALRGR